MQIQTADIKLYFSPKDDTVDPFIQFLNSSKKQIRLADFSFNMDQVVQVLSKKVKQGVDVKLVLDRSQSKGRTEAPEITKLRNNKVPLVIGTSYEHKIMHDKYTVVDGHLVQCGSWNYTMLAPKESNFFFIIDNVEIANEFLTDWEASWDWISKNVPQNKSSK